MFAGSMQLLAGVKLCTGRTLTNHPHYEDSNLRARTKAVRARWALSGFCGGSHELHLLLGSDGYWDGSVQGAGSAWGGGAGCSGLRPSPMGGGSTLSPD